MLAYTKPLLREQTGERTCLLYTSRGKQSAGVDGVGIGLYLTREIVNKQNGYIKVASDEKGTIFSLFLKKV